MEQIRHYETSHYVFVHFVTWFYEHNEIGHYDTQYHKINK